jgi:LETM1 and EF-hand domain-containing protein 1
MRSGRATPRDDEDIDEKEERRMEAEAAGVEKAQVGEAVDAEKEAADIREQEKKADIKA